MNTNLILGLGGSIFTLLLLFELMRRHRLREKYAVFWGLVALLTLVITIFPGLLFWVADLIGVAVPANLLFFLGTLLLLGVTLHLSYEMGRQEDRTRTLAEEVALLRLELEQARRQPRGDDDRSSSPSDG
ncbi:MAG TPA: DUF2304 domain-containing protein [Marmoricola sp.]|nr:DUF2304 domain-containing protein [Marmoricola sp.]